MLLEFMLVPERHRLKFLSQIIAIQRNPSSFSKGGRLIV